MITKKYYSFYFVLNLLIFLTILSKTQSQDQNSSFGIYAHTGITEHSFDYSMIYLTPWYFFHNDGFPQYAKVSGDVWGVGGMYELPFGKYIKMVFRLGYSQYNSEPFNFTEQWSQPTSTIRSTASLQLKEFAAEPLASIKIYDELCFLVGARIGYITEHTVSMASEVISGGYFFPNGTRKDSGKYSFPDDGVLLTSFSMGLSYNFKPFDKTNLVISPEFLFSIGMTDYIRGKEWTITPYRFGLSLKYELPE